jgi:hypothetical protein
MRNLRPIALRVLLLMLCMLGAKHPQAQGQDKAQEQDHSLFQWIKPKAKNEWWINPGFVSSHFDRSAGYNNANWGLGAEYRFSTVASVTAGRFYNSDREYSNYAGVYWQPLAIGPIHVGAVAGGFNGYSKTNNGGWFAALVPAITIEGKRLGANLFIIPTVGDRVHGALSLQVKLKVWE